MTAAPSPSGAPADLRPSFPKVAVGTMNFGRRTPAAEAERIVHRALERGATLFDTANLYESGESERILGAALRGRRAAAQIATKVGLLQRGGKKEGLSAARLVEALEESLGRLGVEQVELYYLHAPDPETPIEDTLDGIERLLRSGKIRSWGVSNHASWQILELQLLADRRGLPRPLASQVLYNLLIRQLDVEYFGFATKHRIHTTVYNPLAGGVLARPPASPGARMKNPLYRKRYGSSSLAQLVEGYRSLAEALGLSLTTLAYAFVAGRPGVDSVLAGPASVDHLDAALDGCATTLPPDVLTRIDALHTEYWGTDARYAR